MAESKYGKYIITELKKDIKVPSYRNDRPGEEPSPGMRRISDHVIWLDDEVVKGANIYSECVWFWPDSTPEGDPGQGKKSQEGLPEHTHPFEEVIAFFGTNLEDPHDLGGEIELWLDGEQHIITKSFIAYIPAGMKHCPLLINKVDKPIFHFTLGPSKQYS